MWHVKLSQKNTIGVKWIQKVEPHLSLQSDAYGLISFNYKMLYYLVHLKCLSAWKKISGFMHEALTYIISMGRRKSHLLPPSAAVAAKKIKKLWAVLTLVFDFKVMSYLIHSLLFYNEKEISGFVHESLI